MEKADVGIVGLGWLGTTLAEYLKNKNLKVWGTRTSAEGVAEMHQRGVEAYELLLNPTPFDTSWKDWFRCRFLVINIPPDRKDEKVEIRYPESIVQLLIMAEKVGVEGVVFVSSTSVFGNAAGAVSDDSPLQPNTPVARALADVEKLFSEGRWNHRFAVIRLGGLYGPERHPGRFLAGKTEVPNGDAPVNFIHRDDAVRVVHHLMEDFPRSAFLNACAPAHPPKKEFYHHAALHAGLKPPKFLSGGAHGKRVSSSRLEHRGFLFQRAGLEM